MKWTKSVNSCGYFGCRSQCSPFNRQNFSGHDASSSCFSPPRSSWAWVQPIFEKAELKPQLNTALHRNVYIATSLRLQSVRLVTVESRFGFCGCHQEPQSWRCSISSDIASSLQFDYKRVIQSFILALQNCAHFNDIIYNCRYILLWLASYNGFCSNKMFQ